MERDDQLVERVSYLADLEREYDMTIRVLAVMVERIQELTGSTEIQVSDLAVADQPDLKAWRNVATGCLSLQTAR